MVQFGDWQMPVQYTSILKEHNHTREKSGLFDVSHMHQFIVAGEHSTQLLLRLVPSDIRLLKHNRQRYTAFLNERGGIIDDIMITRLGEHEWFVISNANRKEHVMQYLAKHISAHFSNKGKTIELNTVPNQVLLALQGPASETALIECLQGLLARKKIDCPPDILEKIAAMRYLDNISVSNQSNDFARISRSGYTGEDGFEMSLPQETGAILFQELTAMQQVVPVGLGARDTLRIEAGLCLYGNDIDETTSPIEAGLAWIVSASRKNKTDISFLGLDSILNHTQTLPRLRIGMFPDTKRPVRQGAVLLSHDGKKIGTVTSGTYAPSLARNIAIGMVNYDHFKAKKRIFTEQKGVKIDMNHVNMPFVEHRFKKK